jgi:uncharacterized protein YbjT (DUF2867 family)
MQGLLHFRQRLQQPNAFFAAAGDAHISAVDVRDLADVAVAALTSSQHDSKISALQRHLHTLVDDYEPWQTLIAETMVEERTSAPAIGQPRTTLRTGGFSRPRETPTAARRVTPWAACAAFVSYQALL